MGSSYVEQLGSVQSTQGPIRDAPEETIQNQRILQESPSIERLSILNDRFFRLQQLALKLNAMKAGQSEPLVLSLPPDIENTVENDFPSEIPNRGFERVPTSVSLIDSDLRNIIREEIETALLTRSNLSPIRAAAGCMSPIAIVTSPLRKGSKEPRMAWDGDENIEPAAPTSPIHRRSSQQHYAGNDEAALSITSADLVADRGFPWTRTDDGSLVFGEEGGECEDECGVWELDPRLLAFQHVESRAAFLATAATRRRPPAPADTSGFGAVDHSLPLLWRGLSRSSPARALCQRVVVRSQAWAAFFFAADAAGLVALLAAPEVHRAAFNGGQRTVGTAWPASLAGTYAPGGPSDDAARALAAVEWVWVAAMAIEAGAGWGPLTLTRPHTLNEFGGEVGWMAGAGEGASDHHRKQGRRGGERPP